MHLQPLNTLSFPQTKILESWESNRGRLCYANPFYPVEFNRTGEALGICLHNFALALTVRPSTNAISRMRLICTPYCYERRVVKVP